MIHCFDRNFEDAFCFIGNFDDTFCSLVVLLMHCVVQKISMKQNFAVILDDALFCLVKLDDALCCIHEF
jgi:hypothetical protein